MTAGLRICELTCGYPGRTVLSNLDLANIGRGQVLSIVGPNASGKSTLLKVLAGFRPYSGEVLLDGSDMADLSRSDRHRRVVYLPQTLPNSSSLLVYEFVRSACRAFDVANGSDIEAEIQTVFEQLGLTDLAFREVRELSGGQRQLMGLAQALIRRPPLLLLDEPTSALDLRWQIEALTAVRNLALQEDAIAIVTLHDINLALRFCDVVAVLGEGGVLASGPPLDVLTPEILRRAYGIEARVEQCSRGLPIILADGVPNREYPLGQTELEQDRQ